ncbi:class I SAM-dependent methyltransferase [Arachnia propionica]|uniref:SAM-dependent methyltransferase n=1 Tax=Arachnia propionica TaxID=1750 RepID=A0A3P1WTT6_9ACTN|nr:class I SAM-dependent methyltransferase [Arachnia propionica]RRD49187.1 SAM-dependent methyltransferase [Arachnia propionica]
MSKINPLPPEALTWLAVWPGVRGLTIGSHQLARRLLEAGHTMFAMAHEERDIDRLRGGVGITPIWARPEAMPIDPCQFDVVFCHQSFHHFDAPRSLSEIARVLRPGGCFSASYVVRDDSVPWVRRLTALLRHYDPMAMRGEYGHDSLDAIDQCKYFPEVEHRAFRIWQEISLPELQKLVASQPLSRNLSETQSQRLRDEVRELFEHAVRPGENLKLPFQLLAWRAWVNHDELTAPVAPPETGIRIDVQVPQNPRWS